MNSVMQRRNYFVLKNKVMVVYNGVDNKAVRFL
jgi:hypothetical protein